MSSRERIVVIGLDAMDPGIARQLVDAGRLPVIASLLKESAWAPTRNPFGFVVGGIWPAFSTATWPNRHGFYCYQQLVAGTYAVRIFTPLEMVGQPFWTALSRAGKRCAIVDVPLSAPSEVNGLQVVEWGAHDRMLPVQTVPATLVDEISDRIGPHTISGRCDNYAEAGELRRLQDDLLRGIDRKLELSTWLLERDDWDVFVTVFSESHCADHQFWFLQDPGYPGHDAEQQRELDRPLERVYEALDAAVGELLERAGDATVFVLLSHGVGPHFDGDHLLIDILQRIDDANGPPSAIVRYREGALRRMRRMKHAVFGRGRYKRDYSTFIDSSRKCFKIPNNELYGGIRFNIAGREPRGRLRPGADVDAWFERLRDDLLDLVNVETGGPVVRQVVRTDDVYDRAGNDALPDVLVDWHRSDPIRSVRSHKLGTISGTYRGIRSGDHRPSGLLLVRGQDIVPGPLDDTVPIVDVAPTIAARLGINLGDVDGRPIARFAGSIPIR